MFEFTEQLGGVPATIHEYSLTTRIFIEAQTAVEALHLAQQKILEAAKDVYAEVELVGFEVLASDKFDEELRKPLWPDVVGFAEIARMAGVTRQTAAGYSKTKSFPDAVITTAQGPLFVKTEIECWLEQRAEARATRQVA